MDVAELLYLQQARVQKLEFLIQNPELSRQMRKASKKKYEKEFTLDKFEHRLKNILETIINK